MPSVINLDMANSDAIQISSPPSIINSLSEKKRVIGIPSYKARGVKGNDI